MKLGTKSVLFGVHQFLWHPMTVAAAWRSTYKQWPKWWEWVAIFCHDLGYWGCPEIDGPVGRQHPEAGAILAYDLTQRLARIWRFLRPGFTTYQRDIDWAGYLACQACALSLGHSRHYAQQCGIPTSRLFIPDKVSLLYDPPWFYLLRARVTGEVWEYLARSNNPWTTPKRWLENYRRYVREHWSQDDTERSETKEL